MGNVCHEIAPRSFQPFPAGDVAREQQLLTVPIRDELNRKCDLVIVPSKPHDKRFAEIAGG
jgi:hypothetical protein